eukprot:935509-Pleurochrysis_carterae.AAC.1
MHTRIHAYADTHPHMHIHLARGRTWSDVEWTLSPLRETVGATGVAVRSFTLRLAFPAQCVPDVLRTRVSKTDCTLLFLRPVDMHM